jgi:hypothetical protein
MRKAKKATLPAKAVQFERVQAEIDFVSKTSVFQQLQFAWRGGQFLIQNRNPDFMNTFFCNRSQRGREFRILDSTNIN